VGSAHHHQYWCTQAVLDLRVFRRLSYRPIIGVNADTEDHHNERDTASTSLGCKTSELADARAAQFGSRWRARRRGGHGNWRQSGSEGEPAMTDQETAELVKRAAAGDELAWRRLIDEFGPLLRHISSTYRLGEAEAADAVATAWSKLVEHIASLRDGCAVQGWLVTTLRRECLARVRARGRERPVANFADIDEPVHTVDVDRQLICADRRRMLHNALRELAEPHRQLIAMLFADPPPSYAEISATLEVPIGSIGPTRMRLLEKLRRTLSQDAPELAKAA
jgi:RNA polymerase sigma factor (sigma-70 family)